MAYKTYDEQVNEHINFLISEGLDVINLQIGTKDFIRCREIGQTTGRGEFAYLSKQNSLRNGYVGIVTICRGRNGKITKKTYGLASNDNSSTTVILNMPIPEQIKTALLQHEAVAKKVYGFWNHSDKVGTSDYLTSKKVGSYGIRFRNNKYGHVAVIPMHDIHGKLWSYQLLNPKTTEEPNNKLFATGARVDNLFHFLKSVVDGQSFGIAESYVTAATCLALTEVPVVCIFSSIYFESSALILRKRFPNSKIILFADNDRHLAKNNGILKAQAALNALVTNVVLAAPDFGGLPPAKNASDWNDLVSLMGYTEAQRQLVQLGVIEK